jgi:hypothetical protein
MKVSIIIEVKSVDLRRVAGVAKKTGKAYCFYEQTGWVDLGKPYPSEMRWIVPEEANPQTGEVVQKAQPVGKYVVDDTCVYVDRNGALQINSKGMKPIAAAAQASLSAAKGN